MEKTISDINEGRFISRGAELLLLSGTLTFRTLPPTHIEILVGSAAGQSVQQGLLENVRVKDQPSNLPERSWKARWRDGPAL